MRFIEMKYIREGLSGRTARHSSRVRVDIMNLSRFQIIIC